MDDWEELESWHEDLMAWERFQDELERINGENGAEGLYNVDDDKLSLPSETSTPPRANHSKPPVEQ
ncbi:hypothetical protein [uncultured Bacteroides sp.]|uniref:hypothetical protein n=1 Tax=uncultured Bacteroides sp. TaxID=162156 RepID=UPI00262A95F9|nr:hypothetical protein [uncultured Bacteroides sp.]